MYHDFDGFVSVQWVALTTSGSVWHKAPDLLLKKSNLLHEMDNLFYIGGYSDSGSGGGPGDEADHEVVKDEVNENLDVLEVNCDLIGKLGKLDTLSPSMCTITTVLVLPPHCSGILSGEISIEQVLCFCLSLLILGSLDGLRLRTLDT